MPWRIWRWTSDRWLLVLMSVVTTGWVLTGCVVWRDVRLNRDEAARREAETVREVQANRAKLDSILSRLPPPATPEPTTQP